MIFVCWIPVKIEKNVKTFDVRLAREVSVSVFGKIIATSEYG